MNALRRLAALAVVAPLVVGAVPARAAERPILDYVRNALKGCWGAVVVVCDPHVSGNPVDTNNVPVPVCAGSCQTVNVPVPGLSDDNVCVAWYSQSGTPMGQCLYRDPDQS